MVIFLLAFAAYVALSALLTVGQIGKEREPVTPGVAVIVVIIDAAIAIGLVAAAIQLGNA